MNTIEFLEVIYRRYTAYVHAYHPATHPDPDEAVPEGEGNYGETNSAEEN